MTQFLFFCFLTMGLLGCHSSPPVGLRVSAVGDVLLARAVPAALAYDSASLGIATRRLWAGSRYFIGNLIGEVLGWCCITFGRGNWKDPMYQAFVQANQR